MPAALQPLFLPAFTLLGGTVTWIEIVAFVLAIWMVVCNMRVDPTGWPLAIVSSLLYFALFWNSRLYGDASLQIVFVVVAGWGWWRWVHDDDSGRRHGPVDAANRARPRTHGPVYNLGHSGRMIAVLAMLALWPITGFFLKNATDTDVPWFDAFPTAGSLVGQWLLGRKYIENWAAWALVNAVSVGLFAYKGLWLTALLYGIFLLMSFAGWRAWQRRLVSVAQ